MPPDKQAAEKEVEPIIEIIEDNDQIDLFDDAPAEKVAAPEKRKKADKKPDSDDALKELQRRHETALENERNARLAAEKRAAEREAELETARKRQVETEGDVISNAKAAALAAVEKATDEQAKAWEDGDYRKAAELNSKIARANAVLLNLDNQEADHKERAATAPAEPDKKADAPASSPQAAFDAFLKTIPPRAQKLFTDNPDLFHNKGNFALVNGAHAAATARGIIFDTDDYYNFITKRLPDDDDGDDDVADDDTDNDDKRVPAAPVSRGAPARGPNGGPVVRAKREWVEAAEFLGMPIKKYMENRAKLIAEGVIKETD